MFIVHSTLIARQENIVGSNLLRVSSKTNWSTKKAAVHRHSLQGSDVGRQYQ